MIIIDRNLPVVVKKTVNDTIERLKANIKLMIQKLWVRIAFGALILLLFSQNKFSVQLTIGGSQNDAIAQQEANLVEAPVRAVVASHTSQAGILPSGDAKWWKKIRDNSNDIRNSMNLANAATAVSNALTPAQQKQAAKYSNLGFALSPGFAKKHNIPAAIVAQKMKILSDYIAKYAATAQEEAKLFGIPASITLAQGLLESNAGKSSLAHKENNHFGIKCRKKCIGCRCANYTDDSRYDMFRIFDSAWESFREHSKLLSGRRYKHLTNLPKTDYKNWANGLQAAGYATDKKYGSKLIKIVEALNLQRFDQ